MKFKDLIAKHSTQSIIKMIHELYPKQRGTLGSYRKIIRIIKNTKVKNPDRTIFVEKGEIDGETFMDCHFIKGKESQFHFSKTSPVVKDIDGCLYYLKGVINRVTPTTYSLIGIKPNKIGSYKVDSASVETYGEIRVIVEVLYKMTWFKSKYLPLNKRFYTFDIIQPYNTINKNKRKYIKSNDLTFGDILYPTSVGGVVHTDFTVGIDYTFQPQIQQ